MPEEMLVKHCSPTLAGMKTGNLFVCGYSSEDEMRDSVRIWNGTLSCKGVRILPLRYHDGKALI